MNFVNSHRAFKNVQIDEFTMETIEERFVYGTKYKDPAFYQFGTLVIPFLVFMAVQYLKIMFESFIKNI